MSDVITPPFQGFPTAATGFFRELALNQSREWFAEHKTDYERFVRAPLGALLEAVTARLATTPLPLVGDPKRSVFRIHRDVRFGADKSPYKTNASAVWSRDGSKTSPGLIYFQFGADEIFVAAGLYMPMPEDLHRLRAGMAWDPEAWAAIRHGLEKRGLTLMSEGALARVPRGFESAPAALHDDLRLKSWVVSRSIALRTARSPELVGVITGHALACAELLEFGWTALEAA
ncbi:MAG: DUF2461 domain-containing protein [Roseateles sp.]|jgi:uncharacterized protein (TIGR02453 family)|nr:DUF2461 domain-containing protein [Methylibium sp.]MBY0365731.1 DUF2461 domain-containing protein [Burkholderiaceae bacterium]|mmetsp:Transcript_53761/g.126790  ORF Transcript_53761/g.126790 Transcript_53761/m.126790 type:complete len:231 (-) Transcript_53761:3863-4555(-)